MNGTATLRVLEGMMGRRRNGDLRDPGLPIKSAPVADDPRLSGPQKRALSDANAADDGARILGLDQHFRPVVLAWLTPPGSMVEYAIQRNGDSADPVLDRDGLLREEWWPAA